MSAHDPQDPHHDVPVPLAEAAPETKPAAAREAEPSVQELLAACAAARTVSTPPADGPSRAA